MSIRELTEAEIDMVSGGDAAATRTPGQDAWGGNTFGGYAHYQQVLWDNWYSWQGVTGGLGGDCTTPRELNVLQ